MDGVALAELAGRAEVVAEIQAGVERVNRQFAQVEQIKQFTLIGEEWMPDSDVLTPTSKLKRRGVHARYARGDRGDVRGGACRRIRWPPRLTDVLRFPQPDGHRP